MDTIPLGSTKPQIWVLNGPNLNRLGHREPEIYGRATLEDVEAMLGKQFPETPFHFFQSNHEGELIDALHEAQAVEAAGVVFNPGSFAHTSIALRDAVASISVPVVEVHISNVYAREDFRHTLVIAPAGDGVITGLGIQGYALAVEALLRRHA